MLKRFGAWKQELPNATSLLETIWDQMDNSDERVAWKVDHIQNGVVFLASLLSGEVVGLTPIERLIVFAAMKAVDSGWGSNDEANDIYHNGQINGCIGLLEEFSPAALERFGYYVELLRDADWVDKELQKQKPALSRT